MIVQLLCCTLVISRSFTSSIQCDAVQHVPVTTVLAVDSVDIGANTDVEYSFVSGDTARFTIDSTTGVVRLAGTTWDFESGMTSFTVTVGATDNPSGTPQLSVSVHDVYY